MLVSCASCRVQLRPLLYQRTAKTRAHYIRATYVLLALGSFELWVCSLTWRVCLQAATAHLQVVCMCQLRKPKRMRTQKRWVGVSGFHNRMCSKYIHTCRDACMVCVGPPCSSRVCSGYQGVGVEALWSSVTVRVVSVHVVPALVYISVLNE